MVDTTKKIKPHDPPVTMHKLSGLIGLQKANFDRMLSR
jgi:hypothetical protein